MVALSYGLESNVGRLVVILLAMTGTSYRGESSDITCAQLQEYVSLVESGELTLKLGPSFRFERLHEAHPMMDENRVNG